MNNYLLKSTLRKKIFSRKLTKIIFEKFFPLPPKRKTLHLPLTHYSPDGKDEMTIVIWVIE